jgi:hypothetical protein
VDSPAPDAADYSRASAAVRAAAALALLTLFAGGLRRAFSGLRVVQITVNGMRQIHSGIIPDYITWLTIGIAVLGTLSAIYLHD